LRRRCPGCGGPLFDGWFRIAAVCPGCRLRTDHGEPDYFLGAVLLNLVLAELVPVVMVLGAVALTWPAPPWRALLGLGVTLAVIAPIVGYPYSKTLWLYVDMQVRPPVYADGSGGRTAESREEPCVAE